MELSGRKVFLGERAAGTKALRQKKAQDIFLSSVRLKYPQRNKCSKHSENSIKHTEENYFDLGEHWSCILLATHSSIALHNNSLDLLLFLIEKTSVQKFLTSENSCGANNGLLRFCELPQIVCRVFVYKHLYVFLGCEVVFFIRNS